MANEKTPLATHDAVDQRAAEEVDVASPASSSRVRLAAAAAALVFGLVLCGAALTGVGARRGVIDVDQPLLGLPKSGKTDCSDAFVEPVVRRCRLTSA